MIIRLFTTFLVFSALFIPFLTNAAFVGQIENFSVDSFYDLSGREEITSLLIKISSQLYFYVDDEWWGNRNPYEQTEIRRAFDAVAIEFEGKIYPQLTSTLGAEWNPGIDNDERITILFHPMTEGAGGYTNYGDAQERLVNPESNEREMVYLNTEFITDSILKSLLAHEFVHLITLNQKNVLRGLNEEVWLNELRAEYAPTLLGYDDSYSQSNLKKRVSDFIKKIDNSLIEWEGKNYDYGAVNLFGQYISNQYGLKILEDSLKSDFVGIESINYALEKNGFNERFDDVFTNWTIASLVNNCDVGFRYCYNNSLLQDFRVIPQTNFLPFSGESTLSLVQNTKDWSGNWYRIVGGKDNLKIEFRGNPQVSFIVPYVIQDYTGNISVRFLELDNTQRGEIELLLSSSENRSITILPSVQGRTMLDGVFPEYQFALIISSTPNTENQDDQLKQQLLNQIEELQLQITKLLSQINAILFARGEFACSGFNQNLFFGIDNEPEVRCLQQSLKDQGVDIYPEGIVSGNFLTLTLNAVIRFQEKYRSEILTPLGLQEGTGFVGFSTRSKLNDLKM